MKLQRQQFRTQFAMRLLFKQNDLGDLQQFQTTPPMFFSFNPQNVMCQPSLVTYVPMDFVYFMPNCQNLEVQMCPQNNFDEKSTSRNVRPPKNTKKVKKPQPKKVFKKSVNKDSQPCPSSQQLNIQSPKQESCGKKPIQNAQRNIMPNIVHQIFCFIQKQKRSGLVVQQYLQSKTLQESKKFNIQRFYLYQRLIRDKTNNYINMKGLRELNRFHQESYQVYSQAQQLNFIRMNRILLKYFLEHEFDNIVLTSSRMKAETRPWHFQIKRKILESLKETLTML